RPNWTEAIKSIWRRGLQQSRGLLRHSKSVRSYWLMPMLNQGSTQWARPPAYDRACLAIVAITPHAHYDSNCLREEGNADITLRSQRADLPANRKIRRRLSRPCGHPLFKLRCQSR